MFHGLVHRPSDILSDTNIPLHLAVILAVIKNPIVQHAAVAAHANTGHYHVMLGCAPQDVSASAHQIDGDYVAGYGSYVSSCSGHWKILKNHFKTDDAAAIAASLVQLFEKCPAFPTSTSDDAYISWVQGIRNAFGTVRGFGALYIGRQLARVVAMCHAPSHMTTTLLELIQANIEPDKKGWLRELHEVYPTHSIDDIASIMSHDSAREGHHIRGLDLAWAFCEVAMVGFQPHVYTKSVCEHLVQESSTYFAEHGVHPPLAAFKKWINDIAS